MRHSPTGMTDQETAHHLTHHLKLAGRSDVTARIHNAALGYPRAGNKLAMHALTATSARNRAIVDEKSARAAMAETGGD